MKITDIKIEKFYIELTEPFKVAFAEITHSVSILIKIQTDEGIEGYGEAAPFAPVTGETTEGTIEILQLFRQGLLSPEMAALRYTSSDHNLGNTGQPGKF